MCRQSPFLCLQAGTGKACQKHSQQPCRLVLRSLYQHVLHSMLQRYPVAEYIMMETDDFHGWGKTFLVKNPSFDWKQEKNIRENACQCGAG